MTTHDFVILGAGLTGLSAASELGKRALVLEKDDRPGGLVKTECFNGYWFDRVIHLLYFRDPDTETRIKNLLGDHLSPLIPEAWVEADTQTARFPLQNHLGHFNTETIVNCLTDFARVAFDSTQQQPTHFKDFLFASFGQTLCELFFYPYNQKMWKRPLEMLAPSGFQWNIARPNFEQIVRGAIAPDEHFESYNDNGWYPNPTPSSPIRGMEYLSQALAKHAHNLKLKHQVCSIDCDAQIILAQTPKQQPAFKYKHACLTTLPLPQTIQYCVQAPKTLKQNMKHLIRNRVWTVTISLKGSRPQNTGHWRYYADESIIFNRLIFMHAFDPRSAPQEGWGMMAEITEPAELPQPDLEKLKQNVLEDLSRINIIPSDNEIVDVHAILVDPAYVVFTLENQEIIESARAFLQEHHIAPVGRYGYWEYSSMAQVMRNGFQWANDMKHKWPHHSPLDSQNNESSK